MYTRIAHQHTATAVVQGDCITPEHVFETLEEDLEVGEEQMCRKAPLVIPACQCWPSMAV
jgi:hypothetical protein